MITMLIIVLITIIAATKFFQNAADLRVVPKYLTKFGIKMRNRMYPCHTTYHHDVHRTSNNTVNKYPASRLRLNLQLFASGSTNLFVDWDAVKASKIIQELACDLECSIARIAKYGAKLLYNTWKETIVNLPSEEAKKRLRLLYSAEGILLKYAGPVQRIRMMANKSAILYRHAHELKAAPEGARTITETPIAKLSKYKIMNFDNNAIFTEFEKELCELYNATDKAEVNAAFTKLEAAVVGKLLTKQPLNVDSKLAKVNTASESMAAEIAGVKYGASIPTTMIVTASHDIVNVITRPKGLSGINGETDDGSVRWLTPKERVRRLQKWALEILTLYGFAVKIGQKTINYVLWAANSTQLKTGDAYFGEAQMMKRTANIRNLLTQEEMDRLPDSGPEILKRQAVLFTPSAPMLDKDGKVVTLDQVIMMPEAERNIMFHKVRVVNGDGVKDHSDYTMTRTIGDGFMMLFNIKTQQVRALNLKGMGVDCDNIPLEVVKREQGKDAKELHFTDIQGHTITWRPGETMILTSSNTDKWKKLGLNWSEFRNRVRSYSAEYPCAMQIRTVRIADSTKERKRHLSRQLTQQLFSINDEEIHRLTSPVSRQLRNSKKLSNVLAQYAALDKPDENRLPLHHLYEMVPGILAADKSQTLMEENFHRKLSNAAYKLPVSGGQYPYLTEDPAYFVKVWMLGEDPNTATGYLTEGQVNLPNTSDKKSVLGIRYPGNFFTAMELTNCNDPIYNGCGNIAILPVDSEFLVRNDGDVDGDEALFITNKTVLEAHRRTRDMFIMPLIVFPHDKATLKPMNRKERRLAMAEAMLRGNEFGPEVGKSSMLATKFFQDAYEQRGNLKARNKALSNAMYAHIAAILAIDLPKTGAMPVWMEEKLKTLRDVAGKNPWNQRFARHTITMPWYDTDIWDNPDEPLTRGESLSTPDRIARALVDTVNAEHFTFDKEGVTFDPSIIMSNMEGVGRQASKGVLHVSALRGINARNYRDEQDLKLLSDIKAGVPISHKDLLKFFWRNESSMWRYYAKKQKDVVDIAIQMAGYHAFVRSCVLAIGEDKFLPTQDKVKRYTIVNHMMVDAFELRRTKDGKVIGNGIGKDHGDPRWVAHLQASWCQFLLKVFAQDLVEIAEENLGVPEKERWTVQHNASIVSQTQEAFAPTLDQDYIPDESEFDASVLNDGCDWYGPDESVEDINIDGLFD